MPIQTTLLRVFVASPSDVNEERSVLEQVISQVNLMIGPKTGIRLDLIRWETHAYPSVGHDPQSVINEQIGDEYDIFIGVVWKKMGTPTGRNVSGTAEEFARAYSRFRENPDRIRVMFYFKEALVSPSELDPQQLSMIKDFRESLGEKGVLFWSYKEVEEFERLVSLHLSRHINDFGKTWNTGIKKETEQVVENSVIETNAGHDDDEGYLDLVLRASEGFNLGTEILGRINDLTTQLTKDMNQRTDEMNQLPQPPNPNQAKTITNQVAEHLEKYSTAVELEIPTLAKTYHSAIDAYTQAAQILMEFDTDDKVDQINQAIETANNLNDSLMEAFPSISSFRDSLQAMPRMTTRLNKAKRHAHEVIGDLLKELEVFINLTTEAEKMMRSLLPG